MLKRLVFPFAAVILLTVAANGAGSSTALMHCNGKACFVTGPIPLPLPGEEPDDPVGECRVVMGGPDVHCIPTTSGTDCAWDLCSEH